MRPAPGRDLRIARCVAEETVDDTAAHGEGVAPVAPHQVVVTEFDVMCVGRAEPDWVACTKCSAKLVAQQTLRVVRFDGAGGRRP